MLLDIMIDRKISRKEFDKVTSDHYYCTALLLSDYRIIHRRTFWIWCLLISTLPLLVMKKLLVCVFCALGVFLFGWVFAGNQSRWQFGDSPDEILRSIKEKSDPYNMIETRLDDNLNTNSQAFGPTNRISNTLDQIRENLDPFVQRMVFIGLSGAVILIIWNAFSLSTSGVVGNDTQSKEIKDKIFNIAKWVVVITAAFFIIRLLLSAVSYILK